VTIFGNYSNFYDLLYKDKDYEAEAKFISLLLNKYAPQSKSILELGCGTGIHAYYLASKGYSVHGIDMSSHMLDMAQKYASEQKTKKHLHLKFDLGDIRSIRLKETFDTIISLFHVVSYQITNADIEEVFVTIKNHLKPDGIFIFDCWYGPAVLHCKPAVRVKSLENDQYSVTRIAKPVSYPNDNRVDVNYLMFVRDKMKNEVQELREVHKMRYLFMPEVENLFLKHGMILLDCKEWMTEKVPGFDTWGVFFVGKNEI